MNSSQRKLLLLLYALNKFLQLLLILKRICKGRRWWIKPHLYPQVRDNCGGYQLIFRYFYLHDHEEFFELTRMSVDQYTLLSELTRNKLTSKSHRPGLLDADLKLAAVVV